MGKENRLSLMHALSIIPTAIHSENIRKKVRSEFRLLLVEYLLLLLLSLESHSFSLVLCWADAFHIMFTFMLPRFFCMRVYYFWCFAIYLLILLFWRHFSSHFGYCCRGDVNWARMKKMNISLFFDYCARLSYHRINVFCIYLFRRFLQPIPISSCIVFSCSNFSFLDYCLASLYYMCHIS